MALEVNFVVQYNMHKRLLNFGIKMNNKKNILNNNRPKSKNKISFRFLFEFSRSMECVTH